MHNRPLLVIALTLAARSALAQQGPVDPNTPLPPGHPSLAPGPVDPGAELPPGHPFIGQQAMDPGDPGDPGNTGTQLPPDHPMTGHGGAGANTPHAMRLPSTEGHATTDLPPRTLVVHVVDPSGAGIAGAAVRVGSMREGEHGDAMNIVTGADGTARINGLPTDGNTAYRVSTDWDGARYSATPFQLEPTSGYSVQLVRFPVDHTGRGSLIWDARMEVHFHDDRLVVVERMHVVNLTGMSLGNDTPHPMAYVPTDGLRFSLSHGYLAFNTAPSMSDLRVTDENGAAMLRGSIPPTSREPLEVAFQYQVKIDDTTVDLIAGLPLPVVSATVVTEAPHGLTLSVDGMGSAEAREAQGQHVLLAGIERRPTDPQLTSLHVHLGGIPASAGPARTVAVVFASVLVLAGLSSVVRRRGKAPQRTAAELAAERARVLAEAAELARHHESGEVGPITYERRRRELALWLASILKAEESLGTLRAGTSSA